METRELGTMTGQGRKLWGGLTQRLVYDQAVFNLSSESGKSMAQRGWARRAFTREVFKMSSSGGAAEFCNSFEITISCPISCPSCFFAEV